MTLVRFTQRIVTDPSFAAQFAQRPHAALTAAHLTLERATFDAMLAITHDQPCWQRLYDPATIASPEINWFTCTTRPGMIDVEKLWVTMPVEPRYLAALRAALPCKPATPAFQQMPSPLLRLPALIAEANDASAQQATNVEDAWMLLYTALHLLDDIEDGDTRTSAYAPNALGAAINITTGLLASTQLALDTLESSSVSPETAKAIRSEFSQTVLTMCAGQHSDLTLPEPTLDQCWQIGTAKSAAFFALACRVGARLAGCGSQAIDVLGRFGHCLGMLIQIGDDVSGLWPTNTKRSDLAHRHWTLPIAFAMSTASPADAKHLRACLQRAQTDPLAEAEARNLVITRGAILYLTVEAQRLYTEACSLLREVTQPSTACDTLLALLASVSLSHVSACPPAPPAEVSGAVPYVLTA